jgi:peptide/nickel transport system permease protein
MYAFAKEIGRAMLILWGVVTAVFFLFNIAPGDPVRNLVGENASQETIDNIRRKYDLDLPLMKRYVLYLNDLSPVSLYTQQKNQRPNYNNDEHRGYTIEIGSFLIALKKPYLKRSFITDKPVAALLAEALPGTLILAFSSIFLALIFGIFMGVIAALNKDRAIDKILLIVSSLGMSGPSFFVAMLVAWLGAVYWRNEISIGTHWILILVLAASFLKTSMLTKSLRMIVLLTASILVLALHYTGGLVFPMLKLQGTGLNMTGSLYAVDVWKGEYLCLSHLILPLITLMVRPLAVIVQLTRSSLLEVLQQDFIRTARAKGLNTASIIWRHALPNALNPVITAVSGWLASLLAGAVFVEFVFGWKGLGQQMFNAIENRDLPVVMGGVIVIGVVFVIINFILERLYRFIDPRIKAAQ